MDPRANLKRNPYGNGYINEAGARAIVKDVDEKQGVVTGYFAAFGNIDAHNDYIERGAFAKTIADWGPVGRKRVRHLFDHNPTHRVGVIKELSEDDHGLRFVSKILGDDHSKGRDALIEYAEGAVTEHSIGFDIIGWRRDEDRDAFALTEIKLYEGSGVAWGANMETPVVDVKGLMEDPVLFDYMIAQMNAMRRVLKRGITDERARELDEQVRQFEQVFAGLKTALYSDEGPLQKDSTQDGEPQADETMLHIVTELNKSLAA